MKKVSSLPQNFGVPVHPIALTTPRPLYVVLGSQTEQDWLSSIMNWDQTFPANAGGLEPINTLSEWALGTKADRVIYFVHAWNENVAKRIFSLKEELGDIPVAIVLETIPNGQTANMQKFIRARGYTWTLKSRVVTSAEVEALFIKR
jgi:hypothetical protein